MSPAPISEEERACRSKLPSSFRMASTSAPDVPRISGLSQALVDQARILRNRDFEEDELHLPAVGHHVQEVRGNGEGVARAAMRRPAIM
jgi:hypothetical protein